MAASRKEGKIWKMLPASSEGVAYIGTKKIRKREGLVPILLLMLSFWNPRLRDDKAARMKRTQITRARHIVENYSKGNDLISLIETGQTKPLLVDGSGELIDGNRRQSHMLLMHEKGDKRFNKVWVVALGPHLTDADKRNAAVGVQMDTTLGWGEWNTAMQVRENMQLSGLSVDEAVRQYHLSSPNFLRERLRAIDLMDEVRATLGINPDPSRFHHYRSLTKSPGILKDLRKNHAQWRWVVGAIQAKKMKDWSHLAGKNLADILKHPHLQKIVMDQGSAEALRVLDREKAEENLAWLDILRKGHECMERVLRETKLSKRGRKRQGVSQAVRNLERNQMEAILHTAYLAVEALGGTGAAEQFLPARVATKKIHTNGAKSRTAGSRVATRKVRATRARSPSTSKKRQGRGK